MKQIIKILAVVSMALLLAGCNRAPESGVSSEISENDSVGSTSSTDSSVSPPSSTHTETHTESIPEKLDYEIFNGLPKSETPLNTVNCKDFRPSLLCYGGENTFFMWDGKVYKHNGDTTEALL